MSATRYRVVNPDQSEVMLGGGEEIFQAGRITHVGSAGLPPGIPFHYDFRTQPFENGQRQIDSVRAMAEAFRRDVDEPQSVELAALQLEVDFTVKRGSNLDKLSLNESALMSTQRWIISALPFDVVTEVVNVALKYREVMAEYVPLIKKNIPDPELQFSCIPTTEETRPDIIALVNNLLCHPGSVNCFVFSEPDNRINVAWRGFAFSPDHSSLSNAMTPAEMIEYLQGDTRIDPQVCYWCSKTALGCELCLCSRCKSLCYCGEDCQRADWKAFHHTECSHLAKGISKRDLGMSADRMGMLNMDGAQRYTSSCKIAPVGSDSIWRGDSLKLYVTHVTAAGTFGDKTKGFPTGWSVGSREMAAPQHCD